MLTKKYSALLFLFALSNLFEIVTFQLVSRIFSLAIEPFILLTIYMVPLLLIRWYQLKSGTISYFLFIAVPILQMISLYFIGYSIMVILLFGIFISWRMFVQLKEPYLEEQGPWLIVALISTFILLRFHSDTMKDTVSWFLLLACLFLVIRIFIHLRKNNWVFMRRSYFRLFLYMIGLFLIISVVYHSGLFLMNTLFPFVGRGLALIASYPLFWIFQKIKIKIPESKDTEVKVEGALQENILSNVYQDSGSDMLTYIIVSLVVIGILVALYFGRKYFINHANENGVGIVLGVDSSSDLQFFNPLKKLRDTIYSRAGKNEIRLQFQKLQTSLEKRGNGRLASETPEEWFDRIGLTDAKAQTVLQLYRTSRYGTVAISHSELANYLKLLKELKQRFSKRSIKRVEGA